MNIWVLWSLFGCSANKQVSVENEITKTFASEIEQFGWLSSHRNQRMIISIRCTFEPLNRQCYLGPSKDHPISIDDTRLGIPLSSQKMNNGWVQVQGIWKPSKGTLSVKQVDLRIDKVLSTPPTPLSVTFD